MDYISSLNALLDESPIPISEEDLSAELSIWANAQFTFDTEPGSAIRDDSYKQDEFLKTLAEVNALNKHNKDINTMANSYYDGNSYTMASQPPPISLLDNESNHGNQSTNIHYQPNNTNKDDIQSNKMNSTHAASATLSRIAPAPLQHNHSLSLLNNQSMTSFKALNKKRKGLSSTDSKEVQENLEDKRRRNTAASARFRMKKKLKEQALEETARAMTLKAEALEAKVRELEKEASWLRALVVEKNPSLLNKQ